jgi:predicted RND superfamily exporter protein
LNSLALLQRRYGEYVVARAWLIVFAILLACAIACAGIGRLSNDPDNRVFFDADDPKLLALETLENTYSKTDNVFFALAPHDGAVFSLPVIEAVLELTEQAWQLPYSSRVDSLTNFQYTRADGDDLIVTDLIEEGTPLSADVLGALEQIALGKEFLVSRLISADASVTGINVTILKPPDDDSAIFDIESAVTGIVADFEQRYPQIDFYVTGGVMYDVAFARLPMQENSLLVPMMFGLILLIVGLSLRTVWATVSVILLIALSVSVAMGLWGWAGTVLNAGTTGAPVIIPTLAVAHCVHLLVSTRHKMAGGLTQSQAVVESLVVNMSPIFITCATTAIGFLSLNFSEAPPFRLLGNIVATGVMVSFVLSVTLLPAFISLVRLKPASGTPLLQPMMRGIANFVIRWHRALAIALPLLVVALALGTLKIELDDNFIEYFSEKFELRRDTDFIEQRLTGLNAIEYSIPAKEPGGISDPHYLAAVDEFVQWLRLQPGVTNVGALPVTMKDLNQSMNGNDPAYYRVPESRELAAQYLLLYEMSLPYGLDLNNSIDIDKSQSRVVAIIQGASSADMRLLNANAEAWLRTNHESYFTEGSGLSMAFAYVSERNIRSMLFGSLLALLSISFILVLALRSVRTGMISLIPNLVPAAVALGIWGYLVGEVGLSVAVVVAVTLGIVVDDTVHFLTKYLRARRQQGMSVEAAIRETMQTVGVALWITSMALVAGFGVLYFSGFKVNAEMGILSAVTILIALIADYMLLPSVLMCFDKSRPPSVESKHTAVP